VKDLLVILGKRIHELRAARKWSQEEFAHVSGLHRTYIGQIERGEKNISFDNLSRVSSVLSEKYVE
jgi:transcriptional regulator with XRE-family HTH domain